MGSAWSCRPKTGLLNESPSNRRRANGRARSLFQFLP
jgi:hypothetical protein